MKQNIWILTCFLCILACCTNILAEGDSLSESDLGVIDSPATKSGVLEVKAYVFDGIRTYPLENVQISVWCPQTEREFQGLTGKDAIARFDLTPGQYVINEVSKVDYRSLGLPKTCTVTENDVIELSVVLKAAPTIAGVVRDEAGKIVVGAMVDMVPWGKETAISDEHGEFVIEKYSYSDYPVQPAAKYIVARHKGRNLAGKTKIEDTTKTCDVIMTEGIVFSGKVVDEDGRAIAGAKICLDFRVRAWGRMLGECPQGEIFTNTLGKYEIKAVPSSDYKYCISAYANGYGKKVSRIYTKNSTNGRLEVGELELAKADQVVSGVVLNEDGLPVADVTVEYQGNSQPKRLTSKTDEQGRFTIENVCKGKMEIIANRSGTGLFGSVETEGGATDVKIVVIDINSDRRNIPKVSPPMVGKPLPEFAGLKLQVAPNQIEGKMLLVCFWDMMQRPSRNCIMQLSKKVKELKAKDIIILTVQASKVEQAKLDEWIKDNNIPFPVGMIQNDVEKTRFIWGVKALPWLILTDKKHIVQAEGFNINELDEKITTLRKK